MKDLKFVRRNYAYDIPKIKMDISITICKCFDKLQTTDKVLVKDMMACIMKESKGHWNPIFVQEELKEYLVN